MVIYPDSIENIPHGLATFVNAAWKAPIIAEGESEVQTALIQIAGRFAESYASDILFILSEMNAFLTNTPTETGRWVIPCGIRKNGVDWDTWIISKLRETQKYRGDYVNPNVYRKILAVIVEVVKYDWGILPEFKLADITDELYRLDPEDEEV